MSNTLSVYWSPHHMRVREDDPHSDFNYIRRLQPAWIRIHQPSATAIYHAQRAAPNAKILLRSWDIDDHNGDRKREMYADPRGAARKHLELWRQKWEELEEELRRNGWAYNTDRWYIGLVNEPEPAYNAQTVEYSLEAMNLVRGTMIRLVLVFSSVGNFSKPSENADGWARFAPLEKPINDGGHILGVHEYWQPEGPNYGEDGGNLAWRHKHIPLNVPILIGESGANGYIYGRYSPNDDSGWQKTVKDSNRFAAQVKEYIEGCDSRVQGVCLYMTDYHSDQWQSFDTQPAMEQLLAIKDTRPMKASPFTVHIPAVGTGPTPAKWPPFDPMNDENWFPAAKHGTVTATVLNARSGPGLDYPIVRQLQQGDAVVADVEVERTGYSWVRVGNSEWAAQEFIGWQGELPTPHTGDKWQRSLAFTLRWEGGWADNPNDKGGATNKGITIGTYTRWRKAQGQPEPSKEDLRRISDAEVETIYREWYWKASGADALNWPDCLAVFDLAVNGGPDRAKEFAHEVGSDYVRLTARRLIWYTNLNDWHFWGNAWTRRCADLLKVAKGT